MGTHRIYIEGIPPVGDVARIEGDEAKHALRVKRLEAGDAVQLLDGAGAVGEGVVEPRTDGRRGEWSLLVRVNRLMRMEPIRPALDVRAATPKGAHLEEMIGALSQVGAATWGPLETERGVVDPREAKLERMQRVAIEASKQCGRAWVMGIASKQTLGAALSWTEGLVIVADASGIAYVPSGAGRIRLLIGPEGGWTEHELDEARRAGARVCSFGPHAMRIETAATVAAGVIMALEHAGDRAESGAAAQLARPPSTPR
jgi:16S rRNA (uracil1498-N3)-methyltransferase